MDNSQKTLLESLSFPVPDQKSGAAAEVLLGKYPGRYNGCGWIAVCNALWLCGVDFKAEEVLRSLSKRLPFRGRFGAMPWQIAPVLRDYGLKVRSSARVKRGLAALEKGDIAIVLCKNRGSAIWHYFALRADGSGQFECFNASPAKGGYEELKKRYNMFRLWKTEKIQNQE